MQTTKQVANIIGSLWITQLGGTNLRNKIAPCGTIAGYTRHRKRNQEVCELCRRAQQEYYIEYNVKRKLERAKYAEYAKREKEATLKRAMLAMEVLARGRQNPAQVQKPLRGKADRRASEGDNT
jgi:hypothetical protein